VVELELVGDYGARAFVTAQIVRGVPLNENQTLLIADYLEPTREQMDALIRVLYSDVAEWYGQHREQVDDPLESLRFIASSVNRSLREPQPIQGVRVRKQVQTPVQLFWEGHLFPATVTEVGAQSTQLVVDARRVPNWEILQRKKPIVGLLQYDEEAREWNRLLAIVESAVPQTSPTSHPFPSDSIQIELRFPERLRTHQEPKIQQLMSGN
jgi:hypothetical protein